MALFFSLQTFALEVKNFSEEQQVPDWAQVPCTALSEQEMGQIEGSLLVHGTNVSSRIQKINRNQRAANSQQPHCDVIAHNRANRLGLNTNGQNGRSNNCNGLTVGQIYKRYPNGRSSAPPAGTSGFYFTSYGKGKQHMGVYSRKRGSSSYTRYANNSFKETVSRRSTSYKPRNVTSQVFVRLSRRSYKDRYHR